MRSGNVMSSMYLAAPAAFSAPSFRRTLRPTALRADAGIAGDYTDDSRFLPVRDAEAAGEKDNRRCGAELAYDVADETARDCGGGGDSGARGSPPRANNNLRC